MFNFGFSGGTCRIPVYNDEIESTVATTKFYMLAVLPDAKKEVFLGVAEKAGAAVKSLPNKIHPIFKKPIDTIDIVYRDVQLYDTKIPLWKVFTHVSGFGVQRRTYCFYVELYDETKIGVNVIRSISSMQRKDSDMVIIRGRVWSAAETLEKVTWVQPELLRSTVAPPIIQEQLVKSIQSVAVHEGVRMLKFKKKGKM